MQSFKTILITFFLSGICCLNVQAQSKTDYSIKSNILNPDTLKGDQKLIFNHFLKWTHKEVTEIKPDNIKKEFSKIGILTQDNDRFLEAYYFFRIDLRHHKKSVENWESFKDLAPGYKKPKTK